MPVNYVKGDATRPQGEGEKIIAHVCNNKGGWGAGFVVALSKKWKAPEQEYRQLYDGNDIPLGTTQFVGVGGGITVANMVAQDGYRGVAIKYDHLRSCVATVCAEAKKRNASVHGPKFGAGLAGGDWNAIEKIIEEELCDKGVTVTIYEYVG